jgi:hypothetical protein
MTAACHEVYQGFRTGVIIDDNVKWLARTLVESKYAFLKNNRYGDCEKIDEAFRFYRGNAIVFSHREFPGLFFKVMDWDEACDSKKAMDEARAIFQRFAYCHVPQAAAVSVDVPRLRGVLITEQARGILDEQEARQQMEQEFERIPNDPKMGRKWRIMTRQLAQATAAIGYWDSALKNLIWDSETGWSFIDFGDMIFPPPLEKRREGLEKLIKIVPYQCIDEIYKVADLYGVMLRFRREDAIANRKAEIELPRLLSEQKEKRGLPRQLDIEKWPSRSLERRILKCFDDHRTGYRSDRNPKNEIKLLWQSSLKARNPADPEYSRERDTERAKMQQALENLQAEGSVVAWKIKERTKQEISYTIFYTIYF